VKKGRFCLFASRRKNEKKEVFGFIASLLPSGFAGFCASRE
jgi:hypothetical protein